MSFFELIARGGLSISLGYVLAFALYVFVMICTIILFEIRKTERLTRERSTAPNERPLLDRLAAIPTRVVLSASAMLILLIALVAVPTFFYARLGSAARASAADKAAFPPSAGFSDTVKLGGIGTIQQNDEVVMRVRIENEAPGFDPLAGDRARYFQRNASWSKTKPAIKEPRTRNDRDLIQVDLSRVGRRE
jgi:hypothetical protein